MKSLITLLTAFAFCLASQQSLAQDHIEARTATEGKILSFTSTISNNKVILNWSISLNESTNYFELEKSTDGKNFIVAALVFTTDKLDKDEYMFYEKQTTGKSQYRIRVIEKDKSVVYSPVLVVETSNK